LFQIVLKKQFGFSQLVGKSSPLVGMNHHKFATVDLNTKFNVLVNRTGLNLNQLGTLCVPNCVHCVHNAHKSNHVKFDVVQLHSELNSERCTLRTNVITEPCVRCGHKMNHLKFDEVELCQICDSSMVLHIFNTLPPKFEGEVICVYPYLIQTMFVPLSDRNNVPIR